MDLYDGSCGGWVDGARPAATSPWSRQRARHPDGVTTTRIRRPQLPQ